MGGGGGGRKREHVNFQMLETGRNLEQYTEHSNERNLNSTHVHVCDRVVF